MHRHALRAGEWLPAVLVLPGCIVPCKAAARGACCRQLRVSASQAATAGQSGSIDVRGRRGASRNKHQLCLRPSVELQPVPLGFLSNGCRVLRGARRQLLPLLPQVQAERVGSRGGCCQLSRCLGGHAGRNGDCLQQQRGGRGAKGCACTAGRSLHGPWRGSRQHTVDSWRAGTMAPAGTRRGGTAGAPGATGGVPPPVCC